MPKSKTAFITGISGQDGSYLADLLLEKGYKVVGFVRRSTNFHYPNINHLLGKIELEFGDLIDQPSIEQALLKHKPDEIYNLAAQSVPADSWTSPMVTGQITALGVVRVLEATRKICPQARFYQATTREIYGGATEQLINEHTPYQPNNPYGIAKLYAHLMVKSYRESYDMFACGGVLFNHESPRRSLHFVTRKVSMAAACVKLGVKHPPIDESGQLLIKDNKLRMGNLDAQRDWGYAKEYVEAMWLMLQRTKPKDYVIGTNTLHSIGDLCQVAFSHVGLDWQKHVVSDAKFLRPTEITATRGDYSLAQKELGWRPKIDFEQLIKMMVDADLKLLSTKP